MSAGADAAVWACWPWRRPFLYLTNRVVATRLLHTVLRGVSKDRLDLLGEEYFEYFFKPRLKPAGVAKLREAIAGGERIVLVSQGLDHIMGALARHLEIESLIANRLEFRDGMATGRLLEPIIRPRGALAKLSGHRPDGRISREALARDLGFAKNPAILDEAIRPATRTTPRMTISVVDYPQGRAAKQLSVQASLAGKKILLIGGTGFIGKVWLANLLTDLPEIGKVFVLVRRNRSTTSLRAISEDGGDFAGLRAAGETARDGFCRFSSRARRDCGRRCHQAWARNGA